MDIIEFAMKMELDGKAFYNKQARVTSRSELKQIFTLLAEEEDKHYNFFKSLKDGKTEQAKEILAGSSETLNQVKNIFVEMSNNLKGEAFGDDEITAWQEALQIEEKAESFYRQKAGEETDDDKKKLLNLIANEERNHVHMIEGVIFYIKFPDSFAESQQFKNFQSLEGH